MMTTQTPSLHTFSRFILLGFHKRLKMPGSPEKLHCHLHIYNVMYFLFYFNWKTHPTIQPKSVPISHLPPPSRHIFLSNFFTIFSCYHIIRPPFDPVPREHNHRAVQLCSVSEDAKDASQHIIAAFFSPGVVSVSPSTPKQMRKKTALKQSQKVLFFHFFRRLLLPKEAHPQLRDEMIMSGPFNSVGMEIARSILENYDLIYRVGYRLDGKPSSQLKTKKSVGFNTPTTHWRVGLDMSKTKQTSSTRRHVSCKLFSPFLGNGDLKVLEQFKLSFKYNDDLRCTIFRKRRKRSWVTILHEV